MCYYMTSQHSLRTGSIPGACDLVMLLSQRVWGAHLGTPPFNSACDGVGTWNASAPTHAQTCLNDTYYIRICNIWARHLLTLFITGIQHKNVWGTLPYEMNSNYYTCIYLILHLINTSYILKWSVNPKDCTDVTYI